MKSAIVVLGSPNDEHGKLLPIAVARCEKVISEYSRVEGRKILCTGGFGEHFNLTKTPHSQYLKDYLLSKGIPECDILELAVSSFTVDDAVQAKPILLRNSIDHIVLVTSDFHMERAKLVFDHVLPKFHYDYSESETPVSKHKFRQLVAHEKVAIERELASFDAAVPV